MTIEHIKASDEDIRSIRDHIHGKGSGGDLHALTLQIPVSAGASIGSTYYMGRYPSNLRFVSCLSTWNTSGLTTSTAHSIQMGTFGNILGQNLGDTVDSAGSFAANSGHFDLIPSVHVNLFDTGKALWDVHNAFAPKDPGGYYDMYLTLTAAMEIGGTITIQLAYTLD